MSAMRRVVSYGALLVVVILVACPANPLLTDVQEKVKEAQAGGPRVSGVTLNKSATTIGVGETEQLTATVAPANAVNQTVSWSTSNTAIADVSATGMVLGKAAGQATITVTTADGSKTATCVVTVQISLATITTTTIFNITPSSATGGGNVTSDGGAAVTARGVCWSISQNPTTADSHTSDGVGTGSFTSNLTGLTLGTTYYVRAYATNTAGTGYGPQVSFSALALPMLTTTAISGITGTTATTGGNVTSDGGSLVTQRGVCWSTISGPTTTDSHTTDGTGTGSFTSSLTLLSLKTTYYVRAYATNSAGTAYGTEVFFTTLTLLPTVTTTAISNNAGTTATGGGNVTADGGANVSARGVCWNTSTNPTTANSKTTDGTGTGSFTSSLTGLSLNTTYYVRAYAINTAGTGYGSEVSFTTPNIPTVTTTTPITAITGTTATGGGNVTSENGAAVTARGVCWSTSTNPTTANSKTTNGTGPGSFTSSLTGLQPLTLYYVRAYATNSAGTAYGSQTSFTTLNNAKAITAFSFTSPAATGTINESAKTITVKLPYGTSVTALVATFTTTGASVKVGVTTQVSGSTANNFTLLVNYLVTAVDGSTVTYVVTAAALTWTERTTAGSRSWKSIASSADGAKLAAVASNAIGGYIYTSTDSGATWTARTGPGMPTWTGIASSSDGTKLVAVAYGNYIYTSTDSGVTWTTRTGPGALSWYSVASSSDGTKLVAGIDGGYIYTSIDSGATWAARSTSGSHSWRSIASSSDGTKLAAVDEYGATGTGGYIYTSIDSGVNWTARTGVAARTWGAIACSSDGLKLAAVVIGDYMFTSTDGGANWTLRNGAGALSWYSIASSTDGTRLSAAAYGDYIYSSTDSGATWTVRLPPGSRYWQSIASSSDGTKLAAAVDGGGYIYTGQ